MVADLNTDGSPRACHSWQQRAEKRAVEILDQLLVEPPARKLAAENPFEQGFQVGSYRVG